MKKFIPARAAELRDREFYIKRVVALSAFHRREIALGSLYPFVARLFGFVGKAVVKLGEELLLGHSVSFAEVFYQMLRAWKFFVAHSSSPFRFFSMPFELIIANEKRLVNGFIEKKFLSEWSRKHEDKS